MIKEFEPIAREITALVEEWEPRLSVLPHDVISERRNIQDRTINGITMRKP